MSDARRAASAFGRCAFAREQSRDERLHFGGNARSDRSHARVLLEDDSREHGELVVCLESAPPRQTLEENAAEREHVRAPVHEPRMRILLRRHVVGRPDAQPRRRERATRDEARDSEVDDLRGPNVVRRHHDVGGLQVTVDDAAGVDVLEHVHDDEREGQALLQREASPAEARAKVFALEPLHHHVWLAARQETVRDVANDGRMIERRERVGFEGEALGAPALAEHLDRDGRVRREIQGAIHAPHSAFAREALYQVPVGDFATGVHSLRYSNHIGAHACS